MYDHITHKLFAGRDVIFHEYAYDDDGQDVWKLPEECNGSARAEESEDQQDDVESQSGVGATSNERSTRRKSGATPPRIEALRRSTRKTETPIKHKNYSLMSRVMGDEEPSNFEK